MSSRSTIPNPKFWPDTTTATPPVHFALTIAQNAIQQHEDALVSLKTQIDTISAAQAAASGGSTTPVTPPATTTSVLGQVNNQTDVTYSVQDGDYGGLITFSNAAPVAVTLNPAVRQFWFASVENLGAGIVTFTPGTGTVNGFASIQVTTNMGAQIFYDGTNWWAFTIPTQPVTFAAVTHEFLNSYNSVTGLYTAVQPTTADISGFPVSAKALATNGAGLPIAATIAGTGAGLVTGPTTGAAGDFAVYSGTTGGIVDSGLNLSNVPRLSTANTFTGKNTFIAPTKNAMTLLNGWTNFGSGFTVPTYWLDPATQLVHLAGVIQPGTSGVIAQLPAGFRPTASQALTMQGGNGSTVLVGQLKVDPTGDLTVTPFASFTQFISLDGLSFPVF